MKFVFFGSPKIAKYFLEELMMNGPMPLAVVTNPDRPAGRNQTIKESPVKKMILDRFTGDSVIIPVLQPEKIASAREGLSDIKADIFIVFAYSQILPQEILSIPRFGTLGVHPSVLPKYRGASPIQTALLNGETETGITLYRIDAKMDHGPIVAQEAFKIKPDISNADLEEKLAKRAAHMVLEHVDEILSESGTEQNHSLATFTKKFTTADAQVDMSDLTNEKQKTIYNKIRAFTPEPGAWTMNYPGYEGKRVKLLSATLNNGVLKITEMQVEGKRPVKI